jgi:hypothetical protein
VRDNTGEPVPFLARIFDEMRCTDPDHALVPHPPIACRFRRNRNNSGLHLETASGILPQEGDLFPFGRGMKIKPPTFVAETDRDNVRVIVLRKCNAADVSGLEDRFNAGDILDLIVFPAHAKHSYQLIERGPLPEGSP